jgi:hypothetical protein
VDIQGIYFAAPSGGTNTVTKIVERTVTKVVTVIKKEFHHTETVIPATKS